MATTNSYAKQQQTVLEIWYQKGKYKKLWGIWWVYSFKQTIEQNNNWIIEDEEIIREEEREAEKYEFQERFKVYILFGITIVTEVYTWGLHETGLRRKVTLYHGTPL